MSIATLRAHTDTLAPHSKRIALAHPRSRDTACPVAYFLPLTLPACVQLQHTTQHAPLQRENASLPRYCRCVSGENATKVGMRRATPSPRLSLGTSEDYIIYIYIYIYIYLYALAHVTCACGLDSWHEHSTWNSSIFCPSIIRRVANVCRGHPFVRPTFETCHACLPG